MATIICSDDSEKKVYGLLVRARHFEESVAWRDGKPTEEREPEYSEWDIELYDSERSRRLGITKWKHRGTWHDVYRFDISLREILRMSQVVPFVHPDNFATNEDALLEFKRFIAGKKKRKN
jgi:Cu2+-containing amine oxidase